MKKITLSYWWSIISGILLALMAGAQLVFALSLFCVGVLFGLFSLWQFNSMYTHKSQRKLFIVFIITFPLVFYGIIIGGLLGAGGIAIYGGAAISFGT